MWKIVALLGLLGLPASAQNADQISACGAIGSLAGTIMEQQPGR